MLVLVFTFVIECVKCEHVNMYEKIVFCDLQVASQTVMHQDQGVMTPVSQVVMAECSTSTKSNEHFTLVSDFAIQINARFIGYRPEGSGRDYTWIQALGILFNSKTLSLEAVKTPQWSENVDHLKFTYNDNPNGV